VEHHAAVFGAGDGRFDLGIGYRASRGSTAARAR
jgi:hypothetical protein